MSPIIDLLNEIRRRPAMYIGCNSVVRLAFFLRGYCYALNQHCAMKNDQFLQGFRDWIANKYSVKSSQGWESIIQFYSAGEEDGMQRFWMLFDEYLAQLPT
jgi:hypothetical protein